MTEVQWLDVNADAVKELQVISGAFNAEYGQAMSGVVNIVTKDGSNDLKGNLTTYVGDYASDRTDKFWDINSISPTAIRDIEGSLSGPVIKDNLFFYLNGRYFYNTGWLYGKQTFLTTDRAIEVPGSGGKDYVIQQHGDNSFVSMNPDQRIYGQGKLTYRLLQGMKLNFNYIIDKEEYQEFNHVNKLTPDNNLHRYRRRYHKYFHNQSRSILLKFLHSESFILLKNYQHYLYKDIYTGDSQHPTDYVDNSLHPTPPYSFNVGGSDYSRFYRSTGTYDAKLDWTTQLTQEINIQFGGDFKQHQIYMHEITLTPIYDNGIQTVNIPQTTTNLNNEYLHKPQEISGYVQSKLEAFNLIFNLGVRFDVFNPDGVVLNDPADPNINNPLRPDNKFFDYNHNGVQDEDEPSKSVEQRLASNAFGVPWYSDASIKYQLSPRIGLAFPITDRGVIHFSYGHFLQLPPYEFMYVNPEFELGVGSGNQGIIGNADLKAAENRQR